jgi:hypothetical protein
MGPQLNPNKARQRSCTNVHIFPHTRVPVQTHYCLLIGMTCAAIIRSRSNACQRRSIFGSGPATLVDDWGRANGPWACRAVLSHLARSAVLSDSAVCVCVRERARERSGVVESLLLRSYATMSPFTENRNRECLDVWVRLADVLQTRCFVVE